MAITLAVDEAPRVVDLPEDIRQAPEGDSAALSAYERLSNSQRKEYVEWIVSAKRDQTRHRRIDKAVALLKDGKKEPS